MLLAVGLAVIDRQLGLQFIGGKFATQSNVVKYAQRLIQALGPMRDDPLHQSPSADWLNIHSLILVVLCFGHRDTSCPSITKIGVLA